MVHAATIFLSSFLLFLVQPLIARLILPWFGGSAAVWTTCMLFFQVLLLGGYAYAHALNAKLRGRGQAIVHTLLLAAAVACLPIAPAESWKPAGGDEPVSRILLLLGATVGLPYFLLAATSPLLQAWYVRAKPHGNPYRLFAISNFASLAALAGYPFVVEPYLAAHEQVVFWSWLFTGFAASCAALAWLTPPSAVETDREESAATKPPYLLWLSLAATGSVLLLAVTNHLTQNVASVPLLWLAPLTLYLLSFILTFEGRGWYRPEWLWWLLLLWLGAMAWLLVDSDFNFDLPVQLGIHLPGLFLGCLFCHGELYRLRPAPRHLTAFYLSVSAGGALGGLLVAVIAPLAFNGYYELGVGLVVLALLAAVRFAGVSRPARVASLAVLLGVTGCAAYDSLRFQRDVRVSARSFYGVLRVKEYGSPGEESYLRRLVHGAIMHGEQYQYDGRRRLITTYYQPSSGIGAAILSAQDRPLRVGVIGLGTGTSAARIEISLGDARLAMEGEPPQRFDVLAVDAFSSDAIPVHLITREALGVYLRHVTPHGIVAFHVSNRFLDLVPVVARIAREHAVHAVVVRDEPDDDDDSLRSKSDWVLVSRDAAALQAPAIVDAGAVPPEDRPDWRTWTDDYSNLIQILK